MLPINSNSHTHTHTQLKLEAEEREKMLPILDDSEDSGNMRIDILEIHKASQEAIRFAAAEIGPSILLSMVHTSVRS